MRFRLVLRGALAAAWAAAAPASAALNPQHAGLQVALRAQGLYLGPIDAIVGPRDGRRRARVPAQRTACASPASPTCARGASSARSARRSSARARSRTASSAGTSRCSSSCSSKHGMRVPVNAYWTGRPLRGVRATSARCISHADGVAGPRDVHGARAADARAGAQVHGRVRMLTRYVVQAGRLAHGDRAPHAHDAREARAAQPAQPGAAAPDRREAAPARGGARRRAARPCRRRTRARRARARSTSWAAHYGVDAQPRPRARLDGVGLQQRRRLVGRARRASCSSCRTPWDYVENVLIGHHGRARRGRQRPRRRRLPPPPAARLRRQRAARARRLVPGRARRPQGTASYKVSKVFVAGRARARSSACESARGAASLESRRG